MKGAHDKGLKWDEDALFKYLADPGAYLNAVNGKEVQHLMTFKLADEQKRRDVIAYLKSINGKPECN